MNKHEKCNGVCDDCSIDYCPMEDKTILTDDELNEKMDQLSFDLNYWFGNGLSIPED